MRIIIATLAATAQMMPLPTSAQTAAAPAAKTVAPIKPAISVCARLATAYDNVSKDLAANAAEGIGDNSAPRATLRAMEDANSLAQAGITLDLMRDNKCTLPKSAPDSATYMLAALTCANDRLKASGSGSPGSCDRTTWKPMGEP